MPLVKLLTEHTQAGVKHYPGETIEMTAEELKWYNSVVLAGRQQQTEFMQRITSVAEEAPAPRTIDDIASGEEIPPEFYRGE